MTQSTAPETSKSQTTLPESPTILLGRTKNFQNPGVLGANKNAKVLTDIEACRNALSSWWNDKTNTIPRPTFVVVPE